MCGINGIFAYAAAGPVSPAELLATRDHMARRGPDSADHWISEDRRLGLGHRRLAIIDPTPDGIQPMASNDGRYLICFNGEIYNYREQRAELTDQGVRFRTHTDTEVLLELYRRDGEAMVGRLRGMFAFAIWDTQRRELFLARDPYGIKPLYYADGGGVLRFASQVQALRAGGGVSTGLSPGGLAGFLVWGSVPEPFTFYDGIQALPAGHSLRVDEAGLGTPRRYWDLAEVFARCSASSASIPRGSEREALREALLDSIRAHLVADVPVGAFLSAGLDSTTIVGLARELSDSEILTITLGSEEFGGNTLDEGPLAATVARHFGVPNHQHRIGIEEFEHEIAAFAGAMDQPTVDGLNTWFVSKAAAEAGLKVALSGLGGDELFGTYHTFARIPPMVARYRRYDRYPTLGRLFQTVFSRLLAPHGRFDPMTAGLLSHGGTVAGAYLLQRAVFRPWELGELIDADLAAQGLRELATRDPDYDPERPGLNEFGKIAYLEGIRYMRNQLLRDSDWTGMAHSLEIRVPFVDSVLTERLAGLILTGRLPPGKTALPGTIRASLPDSVVNRPKTGFTLPIWKWLRKSGRADAWRRNALLRRPNMRDEGRWAYNLLNGIPEAAGLLK